MKHNIQAPAFPDTPRVADLRRRVRAAMEHPAVRWHCPPRIAERFMSEPLAVRKARAIALKLAHMPTDLWEGQRVRPRMKGRVCRSLEDYEAYGRAFYRLAAEHERAGVEGLDDVLASLSENFILAEKPLVFLAGRYLQFARHRLFEV